MDYPFFVQKVAAIPDQVIGELVELALAQKLGVNPLFSPNQDVTGYIGTLDYSCPMGKVLKESVIPLLPLDASTAGSWELNKLCAGSVLTEHTDVSAEGSNHGNYIVKSHKIHVPLLTNKDCTFYHRRSRDSKVFATHMAVGYAYAFNNYVWHSAHNRGAVDRHHLTIRFWDPDWTDKTRLMKLMKIPRLSLYECNPLMPFDFVGRT